MPDDPNEPIIIDSVTKPRKAKKKAKKARKKK